MTAQASLFPELTASSTGVVGLQVLIPRPCQCGEPIAVIGSSRGPHHAAVECSRCGVHRCWLSGATAAVLNSIIDKFGRPTEPITVSTNSRKSADAPATPIER
jgi:hypothetical protein